MEAHIKLRRFRLRRFKAIGEIELALEGDLLLLIGANGAGKSSILQALSFIRYFVEGRGESFFKERGWDPQDLRHRLGGPNPTMLSFDLLLETAGGNQLFWQFDWGLKTNRTLTERIWLHNGEEFRKVVTFSRTAGLSVGGNPPSFRKIRLGGSILSFVDLGDLDDDFPELEQLQTWAMGVTSLELLSPSAIRSSVRGSAKDIGPRGERLAGFLAGLSTTERGEIVNRLGSYYPIEAIDTVRKRAGWIDMKIAEVATNLSVSVEHVSDGFLRLLALAAVPALGETASLVLLDEIEDGIEPHILPRVLRDLRRFSDAQLVVTTHSPILLNHVPPIEAVLVHKDGHGRSQAVRLDQLKTFKAGEDMFGPGELWLNTTLPILKNQAERAGKNFRSLGPLSNDGSIRAFADR